MTGDRAAPSRLKVMLVDDERLVLDLLRSRLEGDGFSVVAESVSAKASIALALVHEPDLIILDVLMPGVAGTEVLPALREASPRADVIVYTALDSPAVLQVARDGGAAAVIDKADGHTRLMQEVSRVALRRRPD